MRLLRWPRSLHQCPRCPAGVPDEFRWLPTSPGDIIEAVLRKLESAFGLCMLGSGGRAYFLDAGLCASRSVTNLVPSCGKLAKVGSLVAGGCHHIWVCLA